MVEYDGAGFHGWAVQPGVRTVEGEVRSALTSLFGTVENVAVAGRTDAGVHALANVVSVDVDGGPPPERAAEALNAVLPDDVAVLTAERAADAFHARFDARSRSYRYRVHTARVRSPFLRHRALWWPRRLDVDELNDNARALLGEHDFRAFTPADTQHQVFTRAVHRAEWLQLDDEVVAFEITADSF